ncbi:MAG: iron-siderophore ABC transporter substrate-binding protein [Spirirestis rafaelensis WJT71-NPBG6]|jgi:iron complex transport system substrate-binding protein|nr:iron-siderophore ABC transporter substrate-binding protein [Spirirestis rafaelensis WJT71-NPBG6]
MRNRLYLYIKLCLLISITLLLVTGCYSQVVQKTDVSKIQFASSNCQLIQHQLGETCIPLQAQRLIVTDEIALDVVLALGLKPIAAAEPNLAGSRGRQFAGKTEGIISLGKESQINLESMLQLHPDLIIGFFINSQNYEIFGKIAPTVKLKIQYRQGAWKNSLQNVGEMLGRNQQAQDSLAQYQQRVKELRKLIKQTRGKIEVSVSRFYAGGQNPQFETIFSFSGGILQEVGLSPPLHQFQLTTSPDIADVKISLERMDLLDADVSFVMLNPGSEKNFQQYQKNQLWQKLKVAKNNQVYTVDSGYWWFGNILAANAILDDLYKYLLIISE